MTPLRYAVISRIRSSILHLKSLALIRIVDKQAARHLLHQRLHG